MPHENNAWVCRNLETLRSFDRAAGGRASRVLHSLTAKVRAGRPVAQADIDRLLGRLGSRAADLPIGDRGPSEDFSSAVHGLGLGHGMPAEADYTCPEGRCPREAAFEDYDGPPPCHVQGVSMDLKPLPL